ncbi:hypothetical protein J8J04_02975 ['Fragaria x ananassa' phyllody phytoplasma]|uniref:Effector n=1 Tax='Fragaria x ananassa' phyllody phytoplasma TaxID=2358428 RepID=A0ABS5K3Y1_9MOLU|nr:hypothetical protein ['Fragaria x ananassa' phyllody phytoplasma]MBS2126631.1 hypothetical protein ['Fragaria x ananassa' phyllody phytoplasma]
MELFKILIIIGILVVLFGVIPLFIYFSQRQQNKNRIKKVNLKQMMIAYYVIFGVTVIGLGGFLYLDIKYDITNKNKVYNIPNSKTETQDEWFQGKSGIRYILDRINTPYKNIEGKWIWHDSIHEEGTWMIKRTYKHYGLDGLDKCQHPESVPTDLAPFTKNPFDKWYESHRENINYFGTFWPLHKSNDSEFDEINFLNKLSKYYYEFEYEGPKWLLEKDKDFFMDEVECPLESNPINKKIYYLHFNPVKGYITLYNQKYNTQKKE